LSRSMLRMARAKSRRGSSLTLGKMPHYWIEFRDKKKIALFIAAMVLLGLFWFVLPADLKAVAFSGRRRVFRLGEMIVVGWIGGWFLLLFVRGEDLRLSAPFDYQSLTRGIGVLMILTSVVLGVIFPLVFVT
jgi:hypothetical protein